jgi:predicted DNA-binding transcriptional regulator AlpA
MSSILQNRVRPKNSASKLVIARATSSAIDKPTIEAKKSLDQLLREDDAALILQVSVKTLQRWRYEGKPPCWHKLGRAVRYCESDLREFLALTVRSSTSDPQPA